MLTLRMLQAVRPSPTAKIRASDIVALRRYDGTISSTIDVLAEAGLLIEDVPTRVEKYFTATFIADGALPQQMEQHLRLWLQVMPLGGSRHSPRQVPRDPATVELRRSAASRRWCSAGPRPDTSPSPRSPRATSSRPWPHCRKGPATGTSPRPG